MATGTQRTLTSCIQSVLRTFKACKVPPALDAITALKNQGQEEISILPGIATSRRSNSSLDPDLDRSQLLTKTLVRMSTNNNRGTKRTNENIK